MEKSKTVSFKGIHARRDWLFGSIRAPCQRRKDVPLNGMTPSDRGVLAERIVPSENYPGLEKVFVPAILSVEPDPERECGP